MSELYRKWPVRWAGGIELPEQQLWLDAWHPKPLCFVSHAHSDHTAAHSRVLASTATLTLMRSRLGGERREIGLEFDEPLSFQGGEVTLLPAGHVLGSAQFFFQGERGSLLYTGDFKLRPGLSSETARTRRADILIMETTYGLPKYHFPPSEEVLGNLVRFCRETLEDGEVPVLFGYSLGKGQEILAALTRAGLPAMLHGSVAKMARIYQRVGNVEIDYSNYKAAQVQGHVLIVPPSASRSRMVTGLKNRRTAAVTGWALDGSARYRYGCDEVFALSDHADYPDLLRMVELVKPRLVYTVHGFSEAFATDLRGRGVEAWALNSNNQLELALGPGASSSPGGTAELPAAGPHPDSAFGRFCLTCQAVGETGSRLKKLQILSAFFKTLETAELGIAATFLGGKPFPDPAAKPMQTGWALIRRTLLKLSGLNPAQYQAISRSQNDTGRTAYLVSKGCTRPEPWSLGEAARFFEELREESKPSNKLDRLESQFRHLSPLEISIVTGILTGELRIGLKEGLLLEALAVESGQSLEQLREARMLTGNPAETVYLARGNQLDQARLTLFRPVQSMLGSPARDSGEIVQRLAPDGAAGARLWVEDKFDGIRAQLHCRAGQVRLYTRDLREITGSFPELCGALNTGHREMVLDGELVAAVDGGGGFFELQKRLGRTTPDLFLQGEIPVRFLAFDLLHLDGEMWIRRPLRERRAALENLRMTGPWERVEVRSANTIEELESEFAAARRRGNEGIMVKDPDSTYQPGRRGFVWMKLKKAMATLDVVVVGVESGHGKRRNWLSDYTFAVRDDDSGELRTIGKAYSGLTDREIEDLTEHFLGSTLERKGRYRRVQPEIVLEIAFDSIRPSRRHQAGLALRFPRIQAIRRDKSVHEIDTLAFARSLVRES